MCRGPACSACSGAGYLWNESVTPILPYACRHDLRQEPDEAIPQVRICAGGAEQSASLPRPVIRPRPGRELFRPTYGHSFGRAQSRVVFVAGQRKLDYKFAPKANRRPSQSRASLKNPRKTQVYEARKNRVWGKIRGLRASVEF